MFQGSSYINKWYLRPNKCLAYTRSDQLLLVLIEVIVAGHLITNTKDYI